MPGPVIYFFDERLAKALSHPLRQRILQRLTDGRVASPSELAGALDEILGNVSYHVRMLRDLDCVELVRTEPRRGALEHYYRATVRPWLDDEQWARLPPSFRDITLGRTFSEIVEKASSASRDGGFDHPGTRVTRVPLAIDEKGRDEIAALLAETLQTARRIHAESADRNRDRDPDTPPMIATELAMLHFRHADDPDKANVS
jgi:DNA-binding transcriptional ArsR family regulator